MDRGHRRPVVNCAMWSYLVVLGTPILQPFRGRRQIQEPMLAEALEPDSGIEADVRVVSRLPWAAEVQHDPVRVGPQIELLRGELDP
jgi:hypothetical protein